jgi:hypothetical protein
MRKSEPVASNKTYLVEGWRGGVGPEDEELETEWGGP